MRPGAVCGWASLKEATKKCIPAKMMLVKKDGKSMGEAAGAVKALAIVKVLLRRGDGWRL